ncbi:hypothetical protein M9Y10_017220 [Tritrichomonas musculus]|uniref:HNH nuclease domain-containing protein n=1 Tax=Tritrichomonas musculus TaxID=1915356 RepID=A0ABR2HVI0_9EUKA
MSYVTLLDHEDYEILNEYPLTIRRKRDQFTPTESFNTNGYIRVWLNHQPYLKHILISKQFIPNDDPTHKTQVDHINHDRTDYHIENLRWVSPSDNCRNKSSHRGVDYDFVDDIPEDSIVVDFYDTRTGHYEFDDYYFYDDVFYLYNGINYRVLYVNETKSGNKFVHMNDINGKSVGVYYSKFKQQHDLI